MKVLKDSLIFLKVVKRNRLYILEGYTSNNVATTIKEMIIRHYYGTNV